MTKKETTPITQMVDVEITGVIPTVQYGNIQPKFVIKADSIENGLKDGHELLKSFWNSVCQKGAELKEKVQTTSTLEIRTCFLSGTEVYFDPINHSYYDKNGNKYLSGSKFAKFFTKDFSIDSITAAMAKKRNAEDPLLMAQEIKNMWALSGSVSTEFGKSVHSAIELYNNFKDKGFDTDSNPVPYLSKNPILKEIVSNLFEAKKDQESYSEVFVAFPELMICGEIDMLTAIDKANKVVRVEDHKTNHDIRKGTKLTDDVKDLISADDYGVYQLQLGFYSLIMTKLGYTVKDVAINHLNSENLQWDTYVEPVIAPEVIEKLIKKVNG